MKALKTRRRRRVAPAPVAPSLQIDPGGDWRRYTRLLPKDCAVLGVVTIAGDDHGALVRLATTGALVKVTGGEVTMLNQSRVRMKLVLLERQQHSLAIEMLEVDYMISRKAVQLLAVVNYAHLILTRLTPQVSDGQ